MPKLRVPLVALATLLPGAASAQTVQDDVFFFRSFVQDARVASASYLHGSVFFTTFPPGTHRYFGAIAGYAPSRKFEVAVDVSYYSPPSGILFEAPSGLNDPVVHGKYNFSAGTTRLSAGGFVSLPVGSKDIGEGDLDAGIFLAMRHPVGTKTAIGGKISADYFEFEKEDRDPSFRLHGGVIHQVADKLALLGEFLMNANGPTGLDVSAGVDYAIGSRSRIRGAVGLGLNENSPDRTILLSFLHAFRN